MGLCTKHNSTSTKQSLIISTSIIPRESWPYPIYLIPYKPYRLACCFPKKLSPPNFLPVLRVWLTDIWRTRPSGISCCFRSRLPYRLLESLSTDPYCCLGSVSCLVLGAWWFWVLFWCLEVSVIDVWRTGGYEIGECPVLLGFGVVRGSVWVVIVVPSVREYIICCLCNQSDVLDNILETVSIM